MKTLRKKAKWNKNSVNRSENVSCLLRDWYKFLFVVNLTNKLYRFKYLTSMTKKIIFIFILLINTNCTINKVVKHHGVHFLEKKQSKLKISETNKNDTRSILGPPSTTNSFDTDVWVYIERKTTVSQLRTLGRKKLLTNNVLVLEFDNRGLLVNKDFYDKDQMNKLKISKNQTAVLNTKQSFINSVLTSLRRKINDPLGKRTAR